MKPETNRYRRLMAALLTVVMIGPAAAFDLDSDTPIKGTAAPARLAPGHGLATYTLSPTPTPRHRRAHQGETTSES